MSPNWFIFFRTHIFNYINLLNIGQSFVSAIIRLRKRTCKAKLTENAEDHIQDKRCAAPHQHIIDIRERSVFTFVLVVKWIW